MSGRADVPDFDLHCHSTVSDGALLPVAVVARAAAHGVRVLALTDHDETGGLAAARDAARDAGVAFVDGVEVSATWRGTTVHIVGLRIDPSNSTLIAGLESVRSGRIGRARRMVRSSRRRALQAHSKARCSTPGTAAWSAERTSPASSLNWEW